MHIIAEAGCNWRTLEEAFQFIDKSKELGLWATKFQLFTNDMIKDNPNFLRLQDLILDLEDIKELFYYGQEIGQEVFFTPMYDCISELEEIGVNYYKIRYADRYNNKLLEKITQTGKTCFISQSFVDLETHGINFYDSRNLFPLYCIPNYPAKFTDYRFLCLGMSDHTGTPELLRLCKKMGTVYHEIHVKLDGTKPLEDAWSISFAELEEVLK